LRGLQRISNNEYPITNVEGTKSKQFKKDLFPATKAALAQGGMGDPIPLAGAVLTAINGGQFKK
jgi:hypothetical protein